MQRKKLVLLAGIVIALLGAGGLVWALAGGDDGPGARTGDRGAADGTPGGASAGSIGNPTGTKAPASNQPGTDPTAAAKSGFLLELGAIDPALAADADRAVPAVAAVWPRDWSRRVLVQAPATVRRMAALLGGTADSYRGIAAVTTGEAGGRADTPAERIVVNPRAYGLLGKEGRQIVMTHEATHVATREHTTGSTPMWLSEGFADWMGYRDTGRSPTRVAPALTAAVRAGEVPRRLPADEDFDFAGDGGRLSRSYESGWLACRMVAERWGEMKLVELYLVAGRSGRDAADGGEAGDGGDGAADGALDTALREVLGIDARELTERWRAYVRQELGDG